MKIAVYTIALNESKHVSRWAETTKDADFRFVADTGSADGTAQLLSRAGVDVAHIRIQPFRFDDARNAALSLLPSDIDVCISLDLDEVLVDGWRDIIESTWQPHINRLKYVYQWNSQTKFETDKVHARHSHRWKQPVHEHLVPTGNDLFAFTTQILITHLADNTKPRSQYLPLLQLAVKEDPTCDRSSHYLARELFFHKRWLDCTIEFHRHLSLQKATWQAERAASMRYIAKANAKIGDKIEVERWFTLATIEDPKSREALIDLARFALSEQRYHLVLDLCERALALPANTHYFCERYPNEEGPSDLASAAAWKMGNRSQAIRLAEQALAMNPADDRLIENLRVIVDE